MMPYNPGDTLFNKYRLERLVGEGAFGAVYLVTHLKLDAPRAIKVLHPGPAGAGSTLLGEARQRFLLESQLGARLNHPNIIQVYDFEEVEDSLVLVMEYAPGGSLADRLSRLESIGRVMPVEVALKILSETAQGLAALHRLDVVHRDLKPSNVLFDAQGNARIADLGLAQVPHGPSLRSQLSQGVAHPGTPGYMSPEQEKTFGYLAPSSDVYALGVIAFLLLTGRMYKGVRPGTHPNTLRPEIPAWLDGLVLRMLDKDPEGRPWDGAELADLLRGGMGAGGREAAQAAAVKQAEKEPPLQAPQSDQSRLGDEHKGSKPAPQRQAAATQQNELSISLAPGVEMAFVRVPAGEFWMGSSPVQEYDEYNEQPEHRVYLDEYWMGKYPVTNRQYRAFIQAARRQAPEGWKRGDFPTGKEKHPVVNVSWEDAFEFCRWAAQVSGQRLRLPTEAEWEKAASGTDGRLYPWGDEGPDAGRCNFDEHDGDTTPVGKYSPQGDSPYGCADMAGNVWEWVNDWYDETYYQVSPSRNPPGPPMREAKVQRGGSWYFGRDAVRATARYRSNPDERYDSFGFRCALTA
jgi:formylglycine-generating enzyme required for sulfatase activity